MVCAAECGANPALTARRPANHLHLTINGPNEVFLYRYGFVEPGNPHDGFEAPSLLQRIRAVELIPHSRLQRLRDLGLEEVLLQASSALQSTFLW